MEYLILDENGELLDVLAFENPEQLQNFKKANPLYEIIPVDEALLEEECLLDDDYLTDDEYFEDDDLTIL